MSEGREVRNGMVILGSCKSFVARVRVNESQEPLETTHNPRFPVAGSTLRNSAPGHTRFVWRCVSEASRPIRLL